MATFATGYRGTVNGSVQTDYADQPGQAFPGMLAFAGDDNFLDSIFIGETNGNNRICGTRAYGITYGHQSSQSRT